MERGRGRKRELHWHTDGHTQPNYTATDRHTDERPRSFFSTCLTIISPTSAPHHYRNTEELPSQTLPSPSSSVSHSPLIASSAHQYQQQQQKQQQIIKSPETQNHPHNVHFFPSIWPRMDAKGTFQTISFFLLHSNWCRHTTTKY